MLKQLILASLLIMSSFVIAEETKPLTYKDKIPELLSYLGERKEPINLKFDSYDYKTGIKPYIVKLDPNTNQLKTLTTQLGNYDLVNKNVSYLYGFGKVYGIKISIPFKNPDLTPDLIKDLNTFLELNGWVMDCRGGFIGEILNKVITNYCSYKKDNKQIYSWIDNSIYNNTFVVYLIDSQLVKERNEKLNALKEEQMEVYEKDSKKLEDDILNIIRIN